MKQFLKVPILLLSSAFLLCSCGNNPAESSSKQEGLSYSTSSTSEGSKISEESKTSEASSDEESVSSQEEMTSDIDSKSEESVSSKEIISSDEVVSSKEELTISETSIVSSEEEIESSVSEESSASEESSSSQEESSSVIETLYSILTLAPAGYSFQFENDVREYKEGDTVRFTAVNTNSAYQIKKVYWYGENSIVTNTIVASEGVYSFTMPAENITIKGEVDRYYSLSLDAQNCTINLTSTVKQYYRNDKVTFTVSVEDDYIIERVYLSWLETEEQPTGQKSLDLDPLGDGSYSFFTRTGAMTLHAIAKEKTPIAQTDPFVASEFQGEYVANDYYRSTMVTQVKFDGNGKLSWALYYKDTGWDDWEIWEAFRPFTNSLADLSDTTTYQLKISSKGWVDYTYDSQTGIVTFGSNSLTPTISGSTVISITMQTNLGSDAMYATRGCVCSLINN